MNTKKTPAVLLDAEMPQGIKYRIIRPLALESYGVFPKNWKPAWPVLVLSEIGDFKAA